MYFVNMLQRKQGQISIGWGDSYGSRSVILLVGCNYLTEFDLLRVDCNKCAMFL